MTDDLVLTPQAPFSDSWSETPPASTPPAATDTPPAPVTQPAADTPAPDAPPAVNSDTVFDENVYVKTHFGYDSIDEAKRQFEELKEKAKEKDFANEDSKKAYDYLKEGKEDDLYGLLHTKKTIKKLINSDLADPKVATELVKFNMLKENNDLTEEDVEYLFNQKFPIPVKPVMEDSELEEEYQQRLAGWEAKVKDVQRGLSIEAKLAKPKLEQYNTELVLPDIHKGSEQNNAVQKQEELQRIESLRNEYLAALESDYKTFNGYEAKYKDEEVEIPVNFVVTDEEKAALKEEMKTFDVDNFIAERWFKEGKPNVKQMMEDVTLLRKGNVVFQKMVNEAGAQVRKHIMGIKGNINVTGEKADGVLDNSEKSAMDKQIEFLWKQKY